MVSAGSVSDQKRTIADVASLLFGKPFQPHQVIGETLARSFEWNGSLPTLQDLSVAIKAPLPSSAEDGELKRYSTASTSTTITTFLTLKRLHEAGFSPKDQKLLSFTDNRQDAALQAGHFNDFIRLARIRSAIAHALREKSDQQLDFSALGEAIFKSLNLPLRDYAKTDDPDP
jgi:hypothetical protein